MIKVFLLCFSLLVCSPSLAQPLVIEAWVKRIPVADSTAVTECFLQKMEMIFEPRRFGFVSRTDTLAMDLLYTVERTSVWHDLLTDDTYSIFMMGTKDGNVIFFITPITRYRARYGLVLSSTNSCNNDKK